MWSFIITLQVHQDSHEAHDSHESHDQHDHDYHDYEDHDHHDHEGHSHEEVESTPRQEQRPAAPTRRLRRRINNNPIRNSYPIPYQYSTSWTDIHFTSRLQLKTFWILHSGNNCAHVLSPAMIVVAHSYDLWVPLTLHQTPTPLNICDYLTILQVY